MSPWQQAVCVLAVAAGGTLIGAWFSRLPKPYWTIGYFLPITVILFGAVAFYKPALAFVPPFSWLMLGHNKFAATGFAAAMVLTTPLFKLPKQRERIAVIGLMIVIVCAKSVWPVLQPAFNHATLARLATRLDRDGVCLQSTDYTCGPAAAVTALRKLGFRAEEGQIAMLAGTGQTVGTPPDILAETLQNEYGNSGLVCELRAFRTIQELRNAGLTLAVVKFNFFTDHFVTVLEVTNDAVVVGDPLTGVTQLSFSEFRSKWRFQGVVLKRK